jgi:hypothetical protein
MQTAFIDDYLDALRRLRRRSIVGNKSSEKFVRLLIRKRVEYCG